MSASPAFFDLPASLTIRNATDVLEAIQSVLLEDAADLTLNAAAVEEVTTPGLQLLAACWQQAKQQQSKFTLTETSQPLKDALACAGLAYLLD